MDLSFSPPRPTAESALPVADMALLMALLEGRQAASATARAQAGLGAIDGAADAPLAPAGGAFNAAMAACLAGWAQS